MKDTPMTLYEKLVEKGGRPTKLKNLAAIHEICQSQYDTGSRDFSVLTIGAVLEERGVMVRRGLYNEAAKDYRLLLDTWQKYAGPAPTKPKPKPLEGLEWLMRISDPAIRMLVQTEFIERKRLAAEVATLKQATTFVVDKRPVITDELQPAGKGLKLTPSERDALSQAIAKAFLDEQGWKEEAHGQILTERGRVIFSAGFATAVRKVLATQV